MFSNIFWIKKVYLPLLPVPSTTWFKDVVVVMMCPGVTWSKHGCQQMFEGLRRGLIHWSSIEVMQRVN